MISGNPTVRPGLDWLPILAAIAIAASGCGGGCGGCAQLEPIPGGFPSAKRTDNAVQVRVTPTGLAAIEANPAALLNALGGATNGVLKFNVPANCGGSNPICCPNGQPKDPCGPVSIDLNARPGDLPRLELNPTGASGLNVVVRARVTTDTPLPVRIIENCTVAINTNGGSPDDITLTLPINFAQQPAPQRTTRVVVGTSDVQNLGSDDINVNGGFFCEVADFLLVFFSGLITDQLTGTIGDTIQEQTCKACESGSVAECGPFANACTNKTCMQPDGQCLQELGLSGRVRGGSLFGSLSPGTTGAIDVYEVAGGYATSNASGLSLGLLGGILPAGTPRDRCGPPGTAPVTGAIPISQFFQGNTYNGQPFGVGFGLHKSQLEQFAFAGYDGGFLCLTITGTTIAQLSTGTLSLISRSLGKLVEKDSPMAVGVRPQSPPVMTLGRNVFVPDGQGGMMLSEPLLDIKFTALELDFFASIDDQYVRVFTLVADVHLPIGLQVTAMAELAPVIGNASDAFTNLSVKNSEAVTETPAQLAALFPNILSLVLPQLSGGLGTIALPDLGGMKLGVKAITGVPAVAGGTTIEFLAIFADLVAPPAAVRPVATTVSLGTVSEPAAAIANDATRWSRERGPSVQLALGGDASDLEWSIRVDQGTWSAWSPSPNRTVTSPTFWLPGTHDLEVRARVRDRPETIDPTPVVLQIELGGKVAGRTPVRGFHGAPGEGGCDCSTGSPASSLPFALVLGLIVLPLRRMRRGVRTRLARSGASLAAHLGAFALVAVIASQPGCSCGNRCGDMECLPGDLEPGGLGRWTSIAADKDRVLVATYDMGYGDLVVADVSDPVKIELLAVDGVPSDVPATHEEGTYRNGIEEPGPNVGAWTSIAMSDGKARVAYQDREAGALKFAYETSPGSWTSHVVDGEGAEEVGRYTSVAIDGKGNPVIAYIALGIDDGMGHRVTELRVARASSKQPGPNDWSKTVIATQPGTCAGICGAGEACIAGAMAETCAAVATNCTAACSSEQACVAGACTDVIAAPKLAMMASGTGLFVSLALLPDGRLAAVYYDRTARALKLAVESASGANDFAESVLHGGMAGDRGMWASAVADSGGTLHVAYQDAIGDQVMYTSWAGTPATPEVVDDGQRTGDRTHSVGAAAAIYLANGAPAIVYQDGTSADVYLATKSGASWSTSALATGPLLDGFSIGAAVDGSGVPYVAWGRLDPSLPSPQTLYVDNP